MFSPDAATVNKGRTLQINITEAVTPDQIDQVRGLVLDYARWLEADHGISLKFQNIEDELAALPGKYAAPTGALRLAQAMDGTPMGCIALRPYQGTTGEVKRLFVAPSARGSGLGTRLVADIMARARNCGFRRLVLDTGEFMGPAQRLYEAHGFASIPPYSPAPPGITIRHLGCDLD
ncbi:MAG: GNAT family N-acetyltransferase [Paracoccaceae bacterium]|nr:GNAT family N-acetyltransferase [Paracoccaceae bacterium]